MTKSISTADLITLLRHRIRHFNAYQGLKAELDDLAAVIECEQKAEYYATHPKETENAHYRQS